MGYDSNWKAAQQNMPDMYDIKDKYYIIPPCFKCFLLWI